ncbi:MAG: MFS transporter [Gammaproteobacteria bacterium]|nr:MFS transporter [Gammaproteobacteria bacterium]MDH3767329.1 MFS transporter [Gammaproteobacteria bacterium]
MSETSQFGLLGKRRFGPFFATQFLGAFNDNVFKNALVLMLAFQGAKLSAIDSNFLINLSAGLFILPFFLFSAIAGQFADKFEKSLLIRRIKLFEIVIMTAALIALVLDNAAILIALLFLLGLQSTLFGPVKYGILPQMLTDEELIGGNGLVEMGTFLAILFGTILGGTLIGFSIGKVAVGVTVVFVAVAGYVVSRRIPVCDSPDPELQINWNPFSQTWRIMQLVQENRTVFLSILGISWFWLAGATYLTQLPNYTRLSLGGNEQVVTLLLATFSVGIGLGSLFCEKLSARRVELGLVPFGSIGLTVFGVDLYFATPALAAAPMVGAVGFVQQLGNLRLLLDLFLLGLFGGFYIVPLYALVQQRSAPRHRSRIIAGNNILNALFMVIAALASILLLRSLSIPQLFLVLALCNAAVAVYIYTLVPEFLMRFIVWLLIHTIYRVDKKDLDRIPEEGAAVLVCNHVSFVDALIIGGCVRRPVRFVMYYKIFKIPILSFVFRTARAIPIAGSKEDPEMLAQALDRIAEDLEAGELVCVFPEGQITRSGDINEFKRGIERIIERTPVPVVPMALQNLWGSFFSRYSGTAFLTWPRKFWSRIGLIAGEAIPAETISAAYLQEKVSELRGDAQ